VLLGTLLAVALVTQIAPLVGERRVRLRNAQT
jgi:hypothetical protein